VLKIGWEYEQEFTKDLELYGDTYDYYGLQFKPYFEFQYFMEIIFDLDRLIYYRLLFDMPLTHIDYFFKVIFNSKK